MKKITFLITLFIVSLSYSQAFFEEDFEGSTDLPSDWTNNDIQGGGDVWILGSGGEAVGYQPPNTIYYDETGILDNYALFDSDSYGDNGIVEDAALESPVLDLTDFTSVTLSFDHFFTAGFGGTGFIEAFDGSSWVQIDSYTGADQGESTFGNEVYDLTTELAGVANAQVRFRWTGDFSWGWAFDNVSIDGETLSVGSFEENSLTHFYKSGQLSIQSDFNLDKVTLFNSLGQEVLNQKLDTNEAQVNVSRLSTGLYIAKVESGNQVKTFKFVKQ
ncbi:T9SS type A sorting domain-containing protein [Psychroflexus tropicus]|uniref:T9SS type A sorting domain-containing protein n=1 Tax=Psychroflexus tropicus TaxID=197345 RepID=UPI00035E30F3|nr:T9SS type A sorting domain-containing protein [Psychroflexus tropicus]